MALFLVGSGAKESTADPPPLLSARRLTRLEYALTEFVVHDGGREAITQPSQAELDLIPACGHATQEGTDGFRITSNHKGDYPIASARLLIGNEDFLISIFTIVPASVPQQTEPFMDCQVHTRQIRNPPACQRHTH